MLVLLPEQVVQYFLGGDARIFEDLPQLDRDDLMLAGEVGVGDLDGVAQRDREVLLEVVERWGAESRLLLREVLLVPLALEAGILALLVIGPVQGLRLGLLLGQKLIEVAIRISLFEVGDAVGTVVEPARQQVFGGLVLLLKENVDLARLVHPQKNIILISDGHPN